MHSLSKKQEGLITASEVDIAIEQALKLPQQPIGITHFFGAGVYIKEARIPAGTYAIGRVHKTPCVNILSKGRVSIVNEDRTVTEFVAPMMFMGGIGRKIGFFHEDTIWQNVYATEETDTEKLEAMFLEVEPRLSQVKEDGRLTCDVSNSKTDYELLLSERGMTEAQVREIVENHSDLIQLPFGTYKFDISESAIQGRGLIVTSDIEEGEIIATARVGGNRTLAGRYTNHSNTPNAFPRLNLDGGIEIVACSKIKIAEEITIDYRQASLVARQLDKEYKLCQVS